MLNPFIIYSKKVEDDRGSFYESYRQDHFEHQTGLKINFLQDNHSISKKNVIRGLHYQWDKPMHKLVRVSVGRIVDVIVDIRKESNNYGKAFYYELNEENNNQLFVPAGFAHGFICLSEYTHVQYKCSEFYNKNGESGINPFDKDLNIDWDLDYNDAIVSLKDKQARSFKEYDLNAKF